MQKAYYTKYPHIFPFDRFYQLDRSENYTGQLRDDENYVENQVHCLFLYFAK